MKMKDTRGESQQGWVRLQIPSDFTLHWINLVDQSLTPHISSLPLSTPKGGEQAPTEKEISGSLLELVCPPGKRTLKVEECYKCARRH